MIRKMLLSGAAIVACSVSAFAADLPSRAAPPVYAPPPPPLFTWTGVYLGGQIGYEFGRDNLFFGSSSPNGVVGGAHVGYNQQVNQFVFGLEGDVNGSSYSGNSGSAFGTTSTRIPIDGSVRGRVGVAFDRALIYGTGGAAFASIKDNFAGPFGFASNSSTRVGWTVGGGIEYAVTNNWSIRAEYRYTDYGHFSDNTGGAFVPRHHETDNRVQVGFSYKFDTFAPAPIFAKY